MLIHLLNPDYGFAMFRPPDQGTPRMANTAKEFTLINLCDPAGVALPIGSNRLRSETIVTMRDHVGRYVVPRGDQVRLEFVTAASAKFLLRKVSGSPGAEIRHGDTIALGAFTTTPTRYRWLQLDTEFKLGGITRTYGGSTQRPRFLEVNDTQVFGTVGLSDAWPTTAPTVQTGNLFLHLSHEGVWKDSHYNVSVKRIEGMGYAIGNRAVHQLPSGGEVVEVRAREGQRQQSIPVKFESLPDFHPCELLGRQVDAPVLLESTVAYRPLDPWKTSGIFGTEAKEGKVVLSQLSDFMSLQAGSIVLHGAETYGVAWLLAAAPAGQYAPFTLTVRNGSTRLGSGGPQGWMCALSIDRFPMAGFDTTASTPLPTFAPRDPRLQVATDGSFEHTFDFQAMTPPPGRHMFCCTVTILGTGANARRFRRRFGLSTLP